MADQPAATTGGPGPDPCRDCRAPLVPGQRYCLYCGARVPQARLEFLDVLVQDVAGVGAAPPVVGAAGPVPVAVASGGAGGVNGWLRHHAPLLGLTGIILATLLIGLLIGHWATDGSTDGTPARAAAPTVVRVEQPAATGVAATTTAGGDAAVSGAGDAKASAAAATATKKASSSSSSSGGGAKPAAKAPADAVSTKALSNLSSQDKEKAIEKAAKKGQPIATGDGKLPPTDEKAPAGGADFETIG
jgi:hypothetical protein